MNFRVFEVCISLRFWIIYLNGNNFKKEEKYYLKKAFLKWDCRDHFIEDFDTGGDILYENVKYVESAQPKLELRINHQILDGIMLYDDGVTYAHKANVYTMLKRFTWLSKE